MWASGCLYAFGSNGAGQLGIGHRNDVSVPTLSNSAVEVSGVPIKIASGGNHTLVLFSSGTTYATGVNRDGRCGSLPEYDHERFEKFYNPHNEAVILSTATWEASFLVTRNSVVYASGSGSKGELGHGEDRARISSPLAIPEFIPPGSRIVDLSACVGHVVAVLSNGDVYGWGNGRKGQLGEPASIVWSPRKIEGVEFKVVRAVCGREFTYLLGSSDEGQHALLGSDKWNVRRSMPSKIRGWTNVQASWGSIYVLFSDHTVRSWGRDDHGQLAPAGLPPLRTIAVGSEHALGLTVDGRLFAWGWGEHGNCGPTVDVDGDVKHRLNEVSVGREDSGATKEMRFIGAGCATSWIWIV